MRIEIAHSRMSRLKGLLGRNDYPHALLLYPCKDIHTFGMCFAIDVAFLSSDGVVIEAHRNIGSRRRLRCKTAYATLERMHAESEWFKPGDRIELKRIIREATTTNRRNSR